MGLKQDIVIVNEFSMPLPTGGGSSGSTPGAYVEQYMARERAVEPLAPIRRHRTDDFIIKYMARENAVDQPLTHRREIKQTMRDSRGRGGVAFGYGQVSLSHDQLCAASADIQHQFDMGKTVMKTVLSFDESYLKRRGIVNEDFTLTQAGDYRGHLDQMKLRMAIMHGIERMSQAYDDLRYVGVIQVDTEHVHCHLAMVDAGKGRRVRGGAQRGKLLDKQKSFLRRGIDAWLDEKQRIAHMSSAVGYERRNVITYIKRWAHTVMHNEALPQFLIACLPQDRSLWRASSRATSMKKPHAIIGELVDEQLQRPGSPFPEAMESVYTYANSRRKNEGLDVDEWKKLIDRGKRTIREHAINGVYQMLRTIPEEHLRVRTPMLDVMSMPLTGLHNKRAHTITQTTTSEAPSKETPSLVEFGYRLRSYASRMRQHRNQAYTYADLARQWETAKKTTVVSETSQPLYDFYRYEALYHTRLVSKYRHFLPFMNGTHAFTQQVEELDAYYQRLLNLQAMRQDMSLQRMKDRTTAEHLGRDVYDQVGGGLLTQGASGRAVIDERIRSMKDTYAHKVEHFREEVTREGLSLVVTTDDTPTHEVRETEPYPFDEVKALDLHHLGYDFFTDVEISESSLRQFQSAMRMRQHHVSEAVMYLESTDQHEAIADLPVDDIRQMVRTSYDIQRTRSDSQILLPSRIAQLRKKHLDDHGRNSPASSLDAGLIVRVQETVDASCAYEPESHSHDDDRHEPQMHMND